VSNFFEHALSGCLNVNLVVYKKLRYLLFSISVAIGQFFPTGPAGVAAQ